MNWMSILGVVFITLGGVLSFLGGQDSDKKSQKELTDKIQEKNVTIDSINSNNIKLISQNSDLLSASKDVSVSNQALITQNENMLSKVAQYQAEIEKKDSIIKDLQGKVNKVARGVQHKIEFDGSIRNQQGGSMTLNLGGDEYQAFIKMQNYKKSNRHLDIIKLCDQYFTKSPNWYAPYILKANALLQFDRKKNRETVQATNISILR